MFKKICKYNLAAEDGLAKTWRFFPATYRRLLSASPSNVLARFRSRSTYQGRSSRLRFGGSRYGNQADAYMLLSPFLKYNAPTMRANSGGWAHVHFWRIAGLTMLNNVGIHWFDYLTALEFNMPEEARDGTETLAYSHRLNTAYAPRNYKKDLRAIKQPLLVVVGIADDAFIADQFEPVISQYTAVQVKLLPDLSHMGVVVRPEVRPIVKEWLESLDKSLPFAL